MQQILLRKHLNPQLSNSIRNTQSLIINALEYLLKTNTNKQKKTQPTSQILSSVFVFSLAAYYSYDFV